MIELTRADNFIKEFERVYSLKVHKIPLEYFDGRRVLLLMCKCSGVWIDLPYYSQGYAQTDLSDFDEKAPFKFVESQDGNLFCTKDIKWQLRDTRAYSNHIYADKLNFSLDLDNNQLIANANVRRKIRKAKTSNLRVVSGGKELVKDFYKVYSQRMYELGSPACGKSLIRRFVKHKSNKIFVVYHNRLPIGGATLSLRNIDSAENVLFATDIRYNHFYTSYLLHDAMIEYARSINMNSYWLGRSTRNSSVHMYKKHFRPTEVDLYWSNSHATKNIRDNKLFRKLWRLLPFRLATLLGPFANRFVY